ncbi:VCBS domain-containing protein [Caenimonas aquaedulcis]|uniref:VCBS domain-containing protein n=1 Tax=Caenimonas aquaedulcis TaxID=2793270 RepID=A0A931H8G1_9BURK|nr:VCBS domain-containing protein [Caenimonas aquaedulcis]MBG9390625.1 VCBS domain-containing protein [Caenimonas aquaedulcis]
MTNAVLGIRGRLEVGDTLTAQGMTSVGHTAAEWALQWQAWNGTSWVNVGAVGATSYTILASQVGWQFRLTGSLDGQAYSSIATAAVTLDTKKDTAPTIAPSDLGLLFNPGEHVTYDGVLSTANFGDADRSNFSGGTLVIQNTNALSRGGDGQDVLSFNGPGALSVNAATGDILSGTTVIGRIDAVQNGAGTDLKVLFNANATLAMINTLVDKVRFSNNDDSPEHFRMLTAVLTDPTGRSAQFAQGIEVTGLPDAPVFTGAAAFTAAENQTAVGAVGAFDPDREAGQPQGIQYSLAAGQGGADNALFQVDAATGTLRFISPPDFESGAHAPAYQVRVRATDSEGSVTDRAITVNVTNVNEAPVSHDLLLYTDENGAPATAVVGSFDPDAGDTRTVTYNAAGLVGTLSFDGTRFTYDPGNQFNELPAYASATQNFTFTVTDAQGLSTTQNASVIVFGTNDPATISGPSTAVLREDSAAFPGASGVLTVTDPDTGEGKLVPAIGSGSAGAGTFIANGASWSYQVDNALLQHLGAGQSVDDVFTVRSYDGTATQQLKVTLTGVNDAPQFGPRINVGDPVEAGNLDDGTVVPGTAVLTGRVLATDADDGDTLTYSGSANGVYGQFAIDSGSGQWTYTLDNARAATNALREGQGAFEGFTVTVRDAQGATSTTSVGWTIRGTNDVPVIGSGSTASGVVAEPGRTGAASFDLAGSYEQAHFVAPSADGSFYLLGSSAQGAALLRFNADGSADTAYAAGGQAAIDGMVSPRGLALDGAGRALVAGYTSENYGQSQIDWAIERRNPDGTPDASFGGGDGRVVLDFGGYDYPTQVLAAADGGVLVAGQGVIVRLQGDGTLDPSFGTGGILTVAGDPVLPPDFEMRLDAQGRLLLWGGTTGDDGAGAIGVFRLLADGSLDTDFGTQGRSLVAIGERGVRDFDLQVAPDGSIALAWSEFSPTLYVDPVSLARLDAQGAPVAGFGVDGIVHTSLNAGALSLAVDAQGAALLAFSAPGWSTRDIDVVRFGANGMQDTAFGTMGVARVDRGSLDDVGTLHVTAAGGILVTGNVTSSSGQDIELARFTGSGLADDTFGAMNAGVLVASGDLFASDADAGDGLSWTGGGSGTYGTFALTPQGHWTYALDPASPALQALGSGQTATETFTATVHDSFGAAASQQVTVTVVGSWDAP